MSEETTMVNSNPKEPTKLKPKQAKVPIDFDAKRLAKAEKLAQKLQRQNDKLARQVGSLQRKLERYEDDFDDWEDEDQVAGLERELDTLYRTVRDLWYLSERDAVVAASLKTPPASHLFNDLFDWMHKWAARPQE